jgi:hypothetical protein
MTFNVYTNSINFSVDGANFTGDVIPVFNASTGLFEATPLTYLAMSTFTPTLSFGGTPITNYIDQEGNYMLLGNAIFLQIFIAVGDLGGGSGAATIGGLPSFSISTQQVCPVLSSQVTYGVSPGALLFEITTGLLEFSNGFAITNTSFTSNSSGIWLNGFFFNNI